MFDFQLKPLRAWACYHEDAVEPVACEQILLDLKAGGKNIPEDWKYESEHHKKTRCPRVIVLDHTRREHVFGLSPDAGKHSNAIVLDHFWWDEREGKWVSTYLFPPCSIYDGYGIPRHSTFSVCH